MKILSLYFLKTLFKMIFLYSPIYAWHSHSTMSADHLIKISRVHGDILAFLCAVTDSAQELPGCGFNGSSLMAENMRVHFTLHLEYRGRSKGERRGSILVQQFPCTLGWKTNEGQQSHAEIATVYCIVWRLCWGVVSESNTWSPCSIN